MKEQVMIATTDDFRTKLRDYLDAVQMSDTQVVVQRYRKPVAVLVNYDVWQRLQQQAAIQGKSNEAK
jgi:prevent-host-death family protein